MNRPHVGRCRRPEHRRLQVYRDGFVTGVCFLGFYVEVPR